MTPEDAASILGVMPTATAAEVEAAYLRQARLTHPDRFVGAGAERIREAGEAFVRVGQARAVLLAHGGRPVPVAPRVTSAPVIGSLARTLRTWTMLLIPGTAFALSGSALDFPLALAVVPVVALAVWLAITGDRRVFTATVIASIGYAVVVAANADFSALLALAILQPAVMAILILRRP